MKPTYVSTTHAGLLIGECLSVNIKRKALQLIQFLTRRSFTLMEIARFRPDFSTGHTDNIVRYNIVYCFLLAPRRHVAQRGIALRILRSVATREVT
jgi:hypothetical protein